MRRGEWFETPTQWVLATTHLERAITAIADEQHGVVSLGQLRSVGLSGNAVSARVGVGRLRRLHRGVFAVRGSVSERGRALAAVLAGGDGAVLSHRSAAHLLGLIPSAPTRTHITTPRRRGGRQRAGLHAHTSRSLTTADTTTHDRIPVTSLPRTLLDLAGAVSGADQLARAIARAETLRSFNLEAVAEILRRTKGHRGHARLAAMLAEPLSEAGNELESAMQRICADARLPAPLVNRWVPLPNGGGVRPDFLWPDRLVAVETDGFETHRTRTAFGNDRARDRRLLIATGIQTHRFTWEEVMLAPTQVGRELRQLLAPG